MQISSMRSSNRISKNGL